MGTSGSKDVNRVSDGSPPGWTFDVGGVQDQFRGAGIKDEKTGLIINRSLHHDQLSNKMERNGEAAGIRVRRRLCGNLQLNKEQ